MPEEAAKRRLTHAMETKTGIVKRNRVRVIKRKTFGQEGEEEQRWLVCLHNYRDSAPVRNGRNVSPVRQGRGTSSWVHMFRIKIYLFTLTQL